MSSTRSSRMRRCHNPGTFVPDGGRYRQLSRRNVWLAAMVTSALVLAACSVGESEQSDPTSDPVSVEASRIATGVLITTGADCSDPTLALFDSPEDVHLSGGPQPSEPVGLPDGEYHVQVTAPDGTVLGSSTDDEVVTVTNGRVRDCPRLVELVSAPSTGAAGFDDTTDSSGRYRVNMSLDPNFTSSPSIGTSFNLRSSGATAGQLGVVKFYDTNANGIADSGEVFMDGWLLRVSDDVDGFATEVFTPWSSPAVPGHYSMWELIPDQSNWRTTTPSPLAVSLITGEEAGVAFGNVCLGAGGAETTEFWTDRSGAALVTPVQLRQLAERNLVTASGQPFDPTTYLELRNWMQQASGANRANALSVSLATMVLNVSTGKVDRDALVHAPATLTANPAGFITISALMDEADAALAASSDTRVGSAQRTYQDSLENPLRRANSNLDFVQSAPCPFSFGQPD